MEILGIRKKDPELSELGRIVHAHMVRIPFENISKLYYLRKTGERNITPLDRYLDGIEQYHFGGTCYANNYHLHQLLRFLGYDVTLCGASMEQPDVHLMNLVKIQEREFIVDAGYGAPFLVPLPRDLPDAYSISLGSDQYIIDPVDENGCTTVTLYRNGAPSHGYRMHPSPRRIEEFRPAIKDSFHPQSTFMNCVMLVRFRTGYSRFLHNLTCLESRGRMVTRRQLKNTDELIASIENTFGIPSAISRVALEGMSMSRSAWS